MKEVQIDGCTAEVLKCIFDSCAGKGYDEILEAAVHLYLYVLNQNNFSASIIRGFFSAAAVIYHLNERQLALLQKNM